MIDGNKITIEKVELLEIGNLVLAGVWKGANNRDPLEFNFKRFSIGAEKIKVDRQMRDAVIEDEFYLRLRSEKIIKTTDWEEFIRQANLYTSRYGTLKRLK